MKLTGAARYFEKQLQDPTYRGMYQMAVAKLERYESMFGEGQGVLVAEGTVWLWMCYECGVAVFDRDHHFGWHLRLDGIEE